MHAKSKGPANSRVSRRGRFSGSPVNRATAGQLADANGTPIGPRTYSIVALGPLDRCSSAASSHSPPTGGPDSPQESQVWQVSLSQSARAPRHPPHDFSSTVSGPEFEATRRTARLVQNKNAESLHSGLCQFVCASESATAALWQKLGQACEEVIVLAFVSARLHPLLHESAQSLLKTRCVVIGGGWPSASRCRRSCRCSLSFRR